MKFSKEIGESLTLKFGQIAKDLASQGKDIISMAVGEPNFSTPKFIEEATIKALKDGYTHYSNSQGLIELRNYIAQDINNTYKTHYAASDVIVTPGVKAGLHLALSAILEPGDEVIIISPYYVSYPPLIKIAEPDAKIIDVPVDKNNNIDLAALEKAFTPKTKCIIMNSPNNPTGKIISEQEVEKIISLARKFNSFILTDEIYDKLLYKNHHFYSFVGRSADDLVIYANGYSKSYCLTGWRIGYVIAPKLVLEKMLKLQQNINTNVNSFVQKGVCSIYENETTHLDLYLPELEARVNKLDNFLKKSKIMRGVKPEAGFFYFVEISRSGLTSLDFAERLIKETGIVVTPGIGFGPLFDNHVRFSLAVDNHTLDLVLSKLRKFEEDCF